MKSSTSNEPSLWKQTLLRLVLLIVLALGVLGIHTFGHPPDLGSFGAGHMTTAAHKIGIVPAAEQGHDGSHGHGDGLHAFTACLAVLGSVLVLSSLSVLRQRRWDLWVPAGPLSWATGGRPAPARRPIGLHLAAVSVVRT